MLQFCPGVFCLYENPLFLMWIKKKERKKNTQQYVYARRYAHSLSLMLTVSFLKSMQLLRNESQCGTLVMEFFSRNVPKY